jgi:hypothetical protein
VQKLALSQIICESGQLLSSGLGQPQRQTLWLLPSINCRHVMNGSGGQSDVVLQVRAQTVKAQVSPDGHVVWPM